MDIENGMFSGLRQAQIRQEQHSARIEGAEKLLAQGFIEAVRLGIDPSLATHFYSGSTRFHPVSEYLGECGEAARALLYRACFLALRGEPCDGVLKDFVGQCAKDYAENNAFAHAEGDE